METKKMLHSGAMFLLLVVIFTLLQEGLAQDEDDTGNTQDTGVGGIVETADNLNVPPVPAPEVVENIINAPTPPPNEIFTGFDTTFTVIPPPPNTVVTVATGHAFRPSVSFAKIIPTLVAFRVISSMNLVMILGMS
jgi:hypothetical protein